MCQAQRWRRRDVAGQQRLPVEHAGDGVVVLGINSEPPETARRYLEAHAVSFPTVTDRDGELARRDAVRAMPVGVVIDRSGRVSAHFTGLRDESAWPDALRKAGLGAGRADHTGKGGRR